MQEVTELFSYFNKDGSGQISFDEFLVALRVCNYVYYTLHQYDRTFKRSLQMSFFLNKR